MLYKLNPNKQDYTKVKRVTLADIGWKELDLQRLMSSHIQDFIYSNDLLTIFNERPRQEEPDILAIDRNGDLYILELKRWSSDRENLLQVLRYGQLYGSSSYDELNELFQKYSKSNVELLEIHKQYFDLPDDKALRKSDFNMHQHFLIVTNGLDQNTVDAIRYWKNNGLSIDAIIYWVFEINGEHYIEFNMYSPIEGNLEYEGNNYVLNTNYSNNKNHTDDMINERRQRLIIRVGERRSGSSSGETPYFYTRVAMVLSHTVQRTENWRKRTAMVIRIMSITFIWMILRF